MARIKQAIDVHSNTMDKLAETLKKSKVYSSEKIKLMLDDLNHGGSPDMTPFFHGLLNYRDAGVIFEYTEHEMEELDKCSESVIYFVENYCTFKNDKGRTLVKLRDYQHKTLHLFGDEVWDPISESVIPKNRRITIMQSRQTAKCLTMSSTVKLKDNKEVKLYDLYFEYHKTPLDKLIHCAYKLNDTAKLHNKLLNLIHKLEIIKYGKDHDEKLIENTNVNNSIEIKSNKKYNHITNIYRTKEFEVYHLELENGFYLDCADTHLIYASINFNELWIYAKDLTNLHYVLTEEGWIKVKSLYNTKLKQFMADLSILENDHSYYSNGILSHNTTTTSCYIIWMLLFHPDKTALVVANKARTGLEIISKIKEVIEDLPYFMKPGMLNLSANKLKFENGSSVSTAAASKSPATGDSLNLLYIDEVALIPANIINEYWASVYPTLSSFRGSLIILSSTPRGKGNLFHKFYTGGMDGTLKGWISNRVDWWEVPEHDEEWLELQRQDLGDDLFQREVELSFESMAGRLAPAKAMLLFNRIKQKFLPIEFYSVPLEVSRKIIWAPDFHPDELTYQDLKNRRFLLSVDLAQGIEAGAVGKKDSDYNIINIFEIEPLSPHQIEKNRNNSAINVKDTVQYKQVGIYMDNLNDESACAEAAKFITFQIFKSGFKGIDNVRILVEMNFNGNNWLNKFKTCPSYYGAVIIKTPNGEKQDPNKPVKMMYGYKTKGGAKGKNYWCERGANLMLKRQLIIRQYDENNINISSIGLLGQFGKTDKGVYMGNNCHDDISVTVLFVSIAEESVSFRQWLNEWYEECPLTYKVQMIRNMLNIYIEKGVQISEEESKKFYLTMGNYFGKLTHEQKGYGSLMNSGMNRSFGLPSLHLNFGIGNSGKMQYTRKFNYFGK